MEAKGECGGDEGWRPRKGCQGVDTPGAAARVAESGKPVCSQFTTAWQAVQMDAASRRVSPAHLAM